MSSPAAQTARNERPDGSGDHFAEIPLRSALRIQLDIVGALILRDIKTRFGSRFAYIFAVLWPLGHLVTLVGAWSIVGAKAPLGRDSFVFFSIGVLQFILSLYLVRWLALAIADNKILLNIPRVKVIDLLISRAILETITAFAIAFATIASLLLVGSTFTPADPLNFLTACGASVLLGLGLGFPAALLVAVYPRVLIGIILFNVLMYILSGVLFLPSTLPEEFRDIISWSPLLHTVEWAREAYYSGYSSLVLDKAYPIVIGVGGVLLGLTGQLLFRRQLLAR